MIRKWTILFIWVITNIFHSTVSLMTTRNQHVTAWVTFMDLLSTIVTQTKGIVTKLGNDMEMNFYKSGPYSRMLSWSIQDFKQSK
ncbi:unnamed protein product [Arctia plantaginis]|uniref:Uncharacterized protein n=1 Tax=Arctia plantaginis TaxID=874455 RepID=A0A8S0YZP9_ARCPL|nr:unnamed protein product [Arctia plantaginis]CAB3252847.1 unnamed protein product [Arctia plantaginis]